MLGNKRETFAPAYEAKDGEGSRKLIWSAKYAIELGADLEETKELLWDINHYWVYPMPKARFEKILKQIERWF